MTELDCEAVLEQVWAYLDGETTEVEYLEIREHVSECEGCGGKYDFQRRLLALIETKCREGTHVSQQLRAQLFRLLEE